MGVFVVTLSLIIIELIFGNLMFDMKGWILLVLSCAGMTGVIEVIFLMIV